MVSPSPSPFRIVLPTKVPETAGPSTPTPIPSISIVIRSRGRSAFPATGMCWCWASQLCWRESNNSWSVGALLKPIPGLGLALVNLPSLRIAGGITTRPTEEEGRAHRENNRVPVDIGFDADTSGGRGQGERKSVTKNHRIRPMFHLVHHWPKYFSLHQESGRVGPIQC